MRWLDRAIGAVSPGWGVRRARNRALLEYFAEYDAGKRSRTRNQPKSSGDADRSIAKAGASLREQARHLEENHDLVNGVMTSLVNNTIGANGISVEPQPKRRNGEIHRELAEQLEELHRDWGRLPEVTRELDRPAMERLQARSWFRDGEYFSQHLPGRVAGLDHGTRVPYSLELLESDLVPMDYDDLGSNIQQGVQKNAWGRPVAYAVYFGHPGSMHTFDSRIKMVPAERMIHGKLIKRIRQTRGVTALASVITRLQDLKDYEESERVAARISAAVAFQIKKGSPELYMPDNSEKERSFPIAPGIVFDNLRVGEEVSDVSSSRPSQLLQPFRDSMLKAVAAGTETNYSTIARQYNGSYSAQRQELVEQFVNYSTLTAAFVGQSARPVWERFVQSAISAGLIRVPPDLNPNTLFDAEFRGPVMPWVDPVKEANANVVQVQAGFKSQSQVIRERGGNPMNVLAEIERERREAADRGLSFSSNPSKDDPDAEE